MKKKRIVMTAALLFTAATVIGGWASMAWAGAKPIVLKFNTVVKSEGAPGSSSQQAFKEELEKRTNGNVKVEYYYSWGLANNTEAVVGGLQMRSFEVSDWGIGSFAEYSKAFLPLDMPYLITGTKKAHEVIRGELGQIMAERLKKDTGLRVLMINHLGFRHVTNSKRPITSPADLKGLKIRTQSNPLHLMGFKAFGASPTPMSFAELFTALQQGVVDGQENPIYNIFATKLYEVQEFLSLTGHLFSGGVFIMSEEYYQSLPVDVRVAIDESAVAAREAFVEEISASEKVWLAEIKKKTQVNELSDEQLLAFQKVAKTQWPQMAKSIGVDYFKKIQEKVEAVENK